MDSYSMNDFPVENRFDFDESKLVSLIIRRILVEIILWVALLIVLFTYNDGLSSIDIVVLAVVAAYILYGLVSIPYSRRVASGAQIILKGDVLSFSTPKYSHLESINLDGVDSISMRTKNGIVVEIKITEKNGSNHSIRNYRNMNELANILASKN